MLQMATKEGSGYSTFMSDDKLSLQQRYQSVIERLINEGYDVAKCLREIATQEGYSPVGLEAGEWLSRSEYKELVLYLSNRVHARHAEIGERKQEAERQEKERRIERYKGWLARNQIFVDKFLEIADRKVSQLDGYGDEKWDALPKEIQTCLLKLARTENDDGATERCLRGAMKSGREWTVPEKYFRPERHPIWLEKYRWLRTRLESEFRAFHDQRRLSTKKPEFDEMSGVEFETFLASLLKQHGFESVRGTAATGDQGGDLLATRANRTIVIQAKRYRGTVGNRAVQEVVAAVKFYGADEGWVITSGTFTSSAKALAQANGVRLIDRYDLRNGLLECPPT